MRAKRKIAGRNWEFDGKIITIRIPMTFKRQGGRKVIIAPSGGDAWAPAKPRRDETLIRAPARAHRWKRMLEDGSNVSINALANVENINRAYVCRLLNLTLLAPDVVESILTASSRKECSWRNSRERCRWIGRSIERCLTAARWTNPQGFERARSRLGTH